MVLQGRVDWVVKRAEACNAVKANLIIADFGDLVALALCPADAAEGAGDRKKSNTLLTELATPQARNYKPFQIKEPRLEIRATYYITARPAQTTLRELVLNEHGGHAYPRERGDERHRAVESTFMGSPKESKLLELRFSLILNDIYI